MRGVLSAALLLCWTSLASAEGGELYITADLGLELARLKYAPPNFVDVGGHGGRTRLLPRFGGALLYGVSDAIRLGLRVSHARSGSTRYDDVAIEGQAGSFFFNYRDTSLGLVATYQWDWGYEWALAGSVEAGPSWVKFNDLAFIEPVSSGRLPFDAVSASGMTYYAGARLMVHWRPNEWFVLEGGPEMQLRGLPDNAGSGTTIFYGLVVSPSFNAPVGPSFSEF